MTINKKDYQYPAKPFVKWVGGKTQLLHDIDKIMPDNLLKKDEAVFVEPFVGGGAVLFWVLQKYPNIKQAIINDINQELITTYRTIKDAPYELLQELEKIQKEYIPLTAEDRKAYYLVQRNRYNKKDSDHIAMSALFIFLNKTCFNGLYRVNSKGTFNVPHGKYATPQICDEQTILTDSHLLQKVEILQGDFSATRRYATEHTFFYLDPPYKTLNATSSFNSYSKGGFDDTEQIRLKNFCEQITACNSFFILSNSDVKVDDSEKGFFDYLYKSFRIQRVWATRMINSKADKRGKLTELMISNILN